MTKEGNNDRLYLLQECERMRPRKQNLRKRDFLGAMLLSEKHLMGVEFPNIEAKLEECAGYRQSDNVMMQKNVYKVKVDSVICLKLSEKVSGTVRIGLRRVGPWKNEPVYGHWDRGRRMKEEDIKRKKWPIRILSTKTVDYLVDENGFHVVQLILENDNSISIMFTCISSIPLDSQKGLFGRDEGKNMEIFVIINGREIKPIPIQILVRLNASKPQTDKLLTMNSSPKLQHSFIASTSAASIEDYYLSTAMSPAQLDEDEEVILIDEDEEVIKNILNLLPKVNLETKKAILVLLRNSSFTMTTGNSGTNNKKSKIN
jgi:hypothetical protein